MLSPEHQQLIIRAGISAPSADNSQPFKCQWHNDSTLHLWIDESRSGKASDNRFVLSDIALGAVIENITIKANDLCFDVNVDYFPEGQENELFVAKILFSTAKNKQENSLNLAAQIPLRTTDRRFPFKGPISAADMSIMEAAAKFNECDIKWFDSKASIKKVLPVIQQAESIRFKSQILHQELFSTVKFGQENAEEGMHISVLAIEKPAQPFFKLMKKWSFMNFVNNIGGATMLGIRSVKIPIMFSPALMLITMKGKERTDVIKAGRAIERVWLQATQCGLSIHPYAAPGIFSLGYINCEAEFKDQMQSIAEQMKVIVNADSTTEDYGLMFLRVGIKDDVKYRTKRRNIDSFIRP